MKKYILRLISSILLLSMGLVLMPKQFFSHHDHHLEICSESNIHFEEKEHECSLCKFLLPGSILTNIFEAVKVLAYDMQVQHCYFEEVSLSSASIFHLRGPPCSTYKLS